MLFEEDVGQVRLKPNVIPGVPKVSDDADARTSLSAGNNHESPAASLRPTQLFLGAPF